MAVKLSEETACSNRHSVIRNWYSSFWDRAITFEYDRAGTVLALAIQYSRRHVRKELRGESFLVLESSQVLIPSACLKTTLFTFSEYNRLLFIR